MSRETVRVGVTWSNSGWCWLDSRLLYTALQVWVRQTNDAGGVFVPEEGRRVPVELLIRDDRSDPETAVAAVTELIDLGVDVFCSSGSAEIQAEVVPVTEAAGVLNLNVGAPDSALFEGSQFHLQCGSSVHTYMASRPPFWKRHGLLRLAQIHAELPGWTATHGPMRDYAAAEGGFDVVLYESVPRQQQWTTAYGPYPADFDRWDDLVDRLVRAQPDVVVLGLPAPAEYQVVRAMRRRGVWFRYLEMLYGQFMGRVGLGPEDLLHQFHPGWTPDIDPATIDVGGTPADLAAATKRYFPGVEGHPVPRSYVGLAVWAHLVAHAGSLEAGQRDGAGARRVRFARDHGRPARVDAQRRHDPARALVGRHLSDPTTSLDGRALFGPRPSRRRRRSGARLHRPPLRATSSAVVGDVVRADGRRQPNHGRPDTVRHYSALTIADDPGAFPLDE